MKPNILFIITDDQRHNALCAAGNPDIITPNLDALAARGTMFTQAHIPCGTSAAVCMPSRAMLHSGRKLFSLSGCGETIPPEHTTMPEVFKASGYDTFGCGKWHNGTPAFARGFTGGDNIFFGGMWDHWNVPVSRHDPTGEYDNVINFTANFAYSKNIMRVHCDKFNPGVHSTELLTDTAINYLNSVSITNDNKANIPFFLYLSYLAPHDPRTMPQKFKDMYDPAKITLPANYMAEHPFPFGIENIRDEMLAAQPRKEPEIREHIADYYAMITHLDHEIGHLMDSLQKNNLTDNTIIVFTSDNGLAVGSHGLMGKQNHYEHSVRVPLIMAGPGVPKAKKVDKYVYLLDIFPTLCDLCGLHIPDSVEGKSFAPMLTGCNYANPDFATCTTAREVLYFVYNDLIRSVKNDRYKLIEYRNHANCSQLFDLLNDPYEINDLAADPSYTETLAQMKKLLCEQRVEWSDFEHPLSQSFWSEG